MIYPFFTNGFLGRALRLLAPAEGGPLVGNDVIALQIACGVTADGVFGRGTDSALRSLQQVIGVVDDGIAGPGTDTAYCLRQIAAHDDGVPIGLARGIVEGESGYRLGAQSPTYWRDGHLKADLGAVQFATYSGDEAGIRRALDARQGVSRLCQHLRDKRALYYNATYVKEHDQRTRLAGWLACGSWNAPAWTDVWASRGPKDPYLQKIVTLQDGSLGTREQWIRNYVTSKITYVTSWAV